MTRTLSSPDKKHYLTWLLVVLIILLITMGILLGWRLESRIDALPTTTPTKTPSPTSIPVATSTKTLSPTNVPPSLTPTSNPNTSICNWASFVKDITIPDDTTLNVNEVFTKTWRLKNVGTCAWNNDYTIIFSGGNMSGPLEQKLGRYVDRDEMIDISIELTTPNEAGEYIAYYKLRSTEGTIFGVGDDRDQPFWVAISVEKQPAIGIKGTDNPCSIFTWESALGPLKCPSQDNSQGSVMLMVNPIVETGIKQNENAIIVQPNDGIDGFISGITDFFPIYPGDRFKSVIGCLEESKTCDVTFELGYNTKNGNGGLLGSWQQTNDGSLDKLDIDLSEFASQDIQLVLTVKSNNDTAIENLVFWLEPRLIRYQE